MNKRTKQTSKNHTALPRFNPNTGWLHIANKHVKRCSMSYSVN